MGFAGEGAYNESEVVENDDFRFFRSGYRSLDINLADIIDTAHDNLFQQVLNDPNHVLAHLFFQTGPPPSITLGGRPRQHDRRLIPKLSKMYDNNFIVRMLYKDVY